MPISRRLLTLLLTALLALSGALITAGQAVAAPRKPLPVPYNFIVDAVTGGLADAPPGSNNWKCKPSAEHPEPVILVHGLVANRADNWQTFSPLLRNHGYCVFAINYGDFGATGGLVGGLEPMEKTIGDLDRFVDRVRQATGAEKVAILGHSEGATMPLGYLKFVKGAAKKVSTMIGISGVAHGTGGFDGVKYPQIGGGNEPAFLGLLPTSNFIHRLNRGGITVPGVAYTQIVTRYDDIVIPYTTGLIHERGAKNIVLQDHCPQDFSDHLSVVSDPNTAQYVLNALDPARKRPVRCTQVMPVVGVLPGTAIPAGVSYPVR